jgi:hypothetical protein
MCKRKWKLCTDNHLDIWEGPIIRNYKQEAARLTLINSPTVYCLHISYAYHEKENR